MTIVMTLGTMFTGMTLGTGIHIQIQLGLSGACLGELASNLWVARPQQVRLCSHHFHLSDLFRQFRQCTHISRPFEKGKAPTAKSSSIANVALFAAVMMNTVSRRSARTAVMTCSRDWLTFVLLVSAQCLTNFLRKLLFRQLSLS